MNISLQFPPTALQPMESDPAQLVLADGTNVDQLVAAFANATSEQEEYLNGRFTVPQNIGSGNVTFRATVRAAIGVASKNVALTFGHSAKGDGEAWDGAHTDEDSGDKAIDASENNISVITWTETVANLGWSAGDVVDFRFSRPAASSDDLAGDMYLLNFEIDIPTA